MKKYMSILMMCARQSIYKILILIVVTSYAELKAFYEQVKNVSEAVNISFESTLWFSSAENMWRLNWGILFLILSIFGCNFRPNKGYLWKRLQLSRGRIWLVQSLYNLGCFVMLWAVQIGLVLGMYGMFCTEVPEQVNHQTFFLACYRSDFLQWILPLESIVGWARLVSVAIFSSIAAAAIVCRVWEGNEE